MIELTVLIILLVVFLVIILTKYLTLKDILREDKNKVSNRSNQ
jgi:hypothetical protein